MSRGRLISGAANTIRNTSGRGSASANRGRGGQGKVSGRSGRGGSGSTEMSEEEIEKEKRIKAYRQEATRLVSKANKRLKRLETKGLTDSPAYRKFLEYDIPKFSVKGKTYNELQREVARMNKFLNSKTSTIRGINSTLKDMARNTGIKYKNLQQLRENAQHFFELASKVDQYLRNTDDSATVIGYQMVWVAINQYTRDTRQEMNLAKMDMDKAIKEISSAVTELVGEQERKRQRTLGIDMNFWSGFRTLR